jgi:hypothetical protein
VDSPAPVTITTHLESWRTEDREITGDELFNGSICSMPPLMWNPRGWLIALGGKTGGVDRSMLMQTEGRKIILRPAWPRTWDALFELHAPDRTTIEGEVRNGEIVSLNVQPPDRKADVMAWRNGAESSC